MTEESSDLRGSAPTHAEITEFTGGMNVPSRLGGRLNVTIPLVRLTISDGTLRMQSEISMFTGFEVPLREITCAFRLRGTPMTAGIGFELSDGHLAYFWTWKATTPILAALHGHGIVIDPEPRRARGALFGQFAMLFNSGQDASPSRVAELPGYSPMVQRLLPLSIVGVTGLCVVCVLTRSWVQLAFGLFVLVWAIRRYWPRSR